MTKWKLVPIEPDGNQIYAMRSAFYRVRRGGAGGQTIDACYQRENAPELAAYSAMLEAAPQPPKSEPIAYIEHHKGGDNLVWDNPGGKYSALYTAPPAPSVPDEELQAAFDRGLKAGNGQKEAQQVEIHRLHDLLAAAPQPKLSDERILEIWANNSGRPVTMGKARIIAQARAIEREIFGGDT